MRDVIVVGAGFAGRGYWIPAIQGSQHFQLIGVVDTSAEQRATVSQLLLPRVWIAESVAKIPVSTPRDAIVFVVTPDHFPVVTELTEGGFRNLVVEKPLVSRDREVPAIRELIGREDLRIYAVDHYYQKFLPLEYVLGRLPQEDSRVAALVATGQHAFDELPGCLGAVEGVTYTNIEAGDLGIPYLDTHPWLEHDPEIGGIIRDLGPHAFAPLMRNGFVGPNVDILDVGLLRFTADRKGFKPVRVQNEIEMYVRTLLVHGEVTVNVTFGKAPFPGKERSLAVRASNGTFFAGLARGQSSVVLTNDGRTTRLSLCRAENDIVITEAELFHTGQLSNFDGNLEAAISALELSQRIREAYFAA